jgi:hypothetical protein
MDLGVGPVDELAVHPDLLEFLQESFSFTGGTDRSRILPSRLVVDLPRSSFSEEICGFRPGHSGELGRRQPEHVTWRARLQPDGVRRHDGLVNEDSGSLERKVGRRRGPHLRRARGESELPRVDRAIVRNERDDDSAVYVECVRAQLLPGRPAGSGEQFLEPSLHARGPQEYGDALYCFRPHDCSLEAERNRFAASTVIELAVNRRETRMAEREMRVALVTSFPRWSVS